MKLMSCTNFEPAGISPWRVTTPARAKGNARNSASFERHKTSENIISARLSQPYPRSIIDVQLDPPQRKACCVSCISKPSEIFSSFWWVLEFPDGNSGNYVVQSTG
jgi:hypothetical protein